MQIVTSTVRIKPLCEVRDKSHLTTNGQEFFAETKRCSDPQGGCKRCCFPRGHTTSVVSLVDVILPKVHCDDAQRGIQCSVDPNADPCGLTFDKKAHSVFHCPSMHAERAMATFPRHSASMCDPIKLASRFCHNGQFRAATILRNSVVCSGEFVRCS